MPDRAQQIVRCMNELEEVRIRRKQPGAMPMLDLIGEMDWLWELHRLVWEE